MKHPTPSFDLALGILSQWARERGIAEHGTIEGQAKKTIEEAGEILDALSIIVDAKTAHHTAQGIRELEDALGDTGVAWIMTCLCSDRDPVQMLFKAIEEIRDRRGCMGVDGIFHKQEGSQ